LGDRVSHEAVLHLAQIPYFLGFVAFFAFPWIFTPNNIKKFIAITMKYPLKMMSAFILMAVILKKFSYIHPYLLADNRHYTFYIWKRILGRDESLLPYAVIPIYVFTAVTMFHLLQRKDSYWKCLFVLCTSVSIVPQKLLELRYFIVAFVIWRINIAPTNPTILSLELALYTLVNAFTIYMFAFYTFKWHDSNDLQRIMW
jgi:alpha-1,2-glucosyltransferase